MTRTLGITVALLMMIGATLVMGCGEANVQVVTTTQTTTAYEDPTVADEGAEGLPNADTSESSEHETGGIYETYLSDLVRSDSKRLQAEHSVEEGGAAIGRKRFQRSMTWQGESFDDGSPYSGFELAMRAGDDTFSAAVGLSRSTTGPGGIVMEVRADNARRGKVLDRHVYRTGDSARRVSLDVSQVNRLIFIFDARDYADRVLFGGDYEMVFGNARLASRGGASGDSDPTAPVDE